VGETSEGIPLWLFSYKAAPGVNFVSPTAQDVEAMYPDAVVELGGVKHIDLARYDWRH
jgi:hypothetical protein